MEGNPVNLTDTSGYFPIDLERDDARSNNVQAEAVCLRWTGFPFKGGFCSWLSRQLLYAVFSSFYVNSVIKTKGKSMTT